MRKKSASTSTCSRNEENLFREAVVRNELGLIRDLLARTINPNSQNEVCYFQFKLTLQTPKLTGSSNVTKRLGRDAHGIVIIICGKDCQLKL